MKKKILIIGNSAKEYALAKKLSETNEIYVAPGSDSISEFATCVDIRDCSVAELLEFVMENGIDMTIPISKNALSTNIVEVFERNNQEIFAPSQNAANIILDKAGVKKLLYKLKITTPRFGIFEKQSMVSDYIKNLKAPFVIKTNDSSSAVAFSTAKEAKMTIDSIFAGNPQKVIIEDYVWGTPFAFYALTDGYKALPLNSSIIYKHSLEGDGGQLTSGMGSCVPNYRFSLENERYVMESVIYPTLDYLDRQGAPYTGILGVNGLITDNGELQILGYQTFMQDSDADGILSLIDMDIYHLFESCILGSFSDEVDYVSQKDISAVSLVIMCKNRNNTYNPITGLDLIGEDIHLSYFNTVRKNKYLEYEAEYGPIVTITALKNNINSAVRTVYDEAENINFNGSYYRKDVGKPVLIDV